MINSHQLINQLIIALVYHDQLIFVTLPLPLSSLSDEVYVSDLVKYGELNPVKSNEQTDLLTTQEILDARALISANGSLFEDELSHVKGVTSEDLQSINQSGMFGALLHARNSQVNERGQIEATP